jgi:hypothetical protein
MSGFWGRQGGARYPNKPQAGLYYGNEANGLAPSAFTLTADTLYLFPVVPFTLDTPVDRLAAYCTTGVASAFVRLGVYSDANGLPGSLILETGPHDATVTNTALVGTISYTVPRGVPLWFAMVSGHAAAVRAVVTGGAPSLGTAATGASFYTRYTMAHTMGALPAAASSLTPTAGSVPWVAFRAA